MNIRDLITKIALGVSIAALIFSVVTLIRSIVMGSGVVMACILVVGTGIVVAICAIMMYVLKNYGGTDDEDEEDVEVNDAPEDTDVNASARSEDAEGADEPAPKAKNTDSSDRIESEVDEIIAGLERGRSYDLSNFE